MVKEQPRIWDLDFVIPLGMYVLDGNTASQEGARRYTSCLTVAVEGYLQSSNR